MSQDEFSMRQDLNYYSSQIYQEWKWEIRCHISCGDYIAYWNINIVIIYSTELQPYIVKPTENSIYAFETSYTGLPNFRDGTGRDGTIPENART